MPDRGSMTLSDLTVARLVVECGLCERRGSYSVARLYETQGDLRLTDFLASLMQTCPKSEAAAIYDRCGARFRF